jgi:hypothetical protein
MGAPENNIAVDFTMCCKTRNKNKLNSTISRLQPHLYPSETRVKKKLGKLQIYDNPRVN